MRKRDLAGTIFWTIVVIILAVAFAATYFTMKFFVVQNWQLYPRNQEMLDLRDQMVSVEEYNGLALQMPETRIVWHVPFHNMYVDSSLEEITVEELTDTDVEMVEYLPDLKVIHADACQDYEYLKAIFERYPDVQVRYNVTVSGQEYPSDTKTVALSSLTEEDVQNMQYLPRLSKVDGSGCRDYAMMYEAQKAHPEWHLTFLNSVAGVALDPEATAFEVTGARYEELSTGLAAMPNLKKVTIHDPKASGEELTALREEYPDVKIHWDLTFGGVTYQDDVKELDISHTQVGSVDVAREIGSKFPQLTKLIVDSAGIPNEEMAEFRDEVRSQYKVVWTIIFTSKCKARTDDTYFMPTKQGEYYFEEKNVHDVRYLEDVIALDLGHHAIRTTEFLRYMPNLKYLVLTDTQVLTITDIEYCKELIFLEVDWNCVRDLGNIQECTKLEDLSICDGLVDPEVVKQLTWLKHLRWDHRGAGTLADIDAALPDTIVTSESYGAGAFYWRNLQNYYDSRDVLGMYYMK